MSLLLVLACAQPPQTDAALPGLVRASLDLRGVRPSDEELDQVAAGGDEALDTLVEAFLHDERFPGRVRDLWGELYQTRLDGWPLSGEEVGLAEDEHEAFRVAVGEEPLRLLSTVADEDLPWTTLVTADWSMADETLARVWPVARLPGDPGWKKVSYTDSRPAAGVLATNGLWWRYKTSWSNAGRARARAAAQLLVCHDYLAQPVVFDREVDLADPDAVAHALTEVPGCVACHSTLDPLAAAFSGFFWEGKGDPQELLEYHPEREGLWRELTGVGPGWYGQPVEGLDALGARIAADPRFIDCAVEQAFTLLLQRPVQLDDSADLTRHRQAFLDGDIALRPLLASILASPEYRDPTRGAPKLAGPELLETQVEALTGFRFVVEGQSMLTTDRLGLRTIAGGVDGELSTDRVTEPSPGLVLVQQRVAEAAAAHAVALHRAGGAPVFDGIDLDAADHDSLVAAMQLLERRVLSRVLDPDDPDLQDLVALWRALHDQAGDVDAAWVGVLTLLLRDPALVLY